MGATETEMNGSQRLVVVFFVFFQVANCHPAVTQPPPPPQISSITTHPSEPSAPAAITQYLSGAEDKQVLSATSHHLLSFNSPQLTVQFLYHSNICVTFEQTIA